MSAAKRSPATTDLFRDNAFTGLSCLRFVSQFPRIAVVHFRRARCLIWYRALAKRTPHLVMSNVDTRQVDRDSLFLLAQLRVDGQDQSHRVKVRNLSAGGMMAEGDIKVMRGALVELELRNLGWVEGTVAWKQDNRFGIAFVDDIDPKLARDTISAPSSVPRPARFTQAAHNLRKL